MPIPASASHRVVYATYLAAGGNPAEGFVTFQPRFILTDAQDATFVTTTVVRGDIDPVTGYMSVDLMCTDDADIAPPGWTWHVKEHVDGGREYDIFVPYGIGPIPLTGLATAIASGNFAEAYIPWSAAGASGGVAPLDATKKIPLIYLPDSNAVVVYSPIAPSSPDPNQLWWNTTTQIFYRWDYATATWIPVVAKSTNETFTFTVAGPVTISSQDIRYYMDYAVNLESARISVGQSPVDGPGVEVDILVDGVSIFGAPIDRPVIAPGSFTANVTLSGTVLAGSYITFNITSVGLTTPGSGLVLVIRGDRSL
jgi:hypothetical protein